MMRSFKLCRVQGIDIKIHPTFALILLWVFFNWGTGDRGGVGSFVFGLVFVGLVFFCVLIHELGHSFMAMHYGVRVHDITLWPFGGVARIEQVPARPMSEVMIAIAGPAMNIAIFVALLPILLLLGVVNGFSSPSDYLGYLYSSSLAALLVYVALTNIMLVLFNMLPAFPMDGGRVLRAGLSLIVGRDTATRSAVLIGQVAAIGLAGLGLWIHDYLLPLVAIFVAVAAQAEGRAVRVESAMRRLEVGQLALWDMGGIAPHHPLTYALRGGPRDLVVTEGGRVVGMLWRNQLLHDLNGGAAGRTVADVMDTDVFTADIKESVYDVQHRMNQLNRWAVPVTEDGLYRGIFTADRFVHVYHQLTPKLIPSRARSATSWSTVVGDTIRAWVR